RLRTSAVRLAEPVQRNAEHRIAPNGADAAQRNAAEPRHVFWRARDDRLAAAFAEEHDRVVGKLQPGADPAPKSRLREADREPALGGVVRQREERSGA